MQFPSESDALMGKPGKAQIVTSPLAADHLFNFEELLYPLLCCRMGWHRVPALEWWIS